MINNFKVKFLMTNQGILIYRLFFVCKPVIPPTRLLEDTFKMFKGFRNINVIDGKNYGYVIYDSLESATRAINVIIV